MPDYRMLYFQLYARTEQAIRLLQQAQQEAETAFLAADPPPLYLDERDPEPET